jgi:thiol-disulfide isomerase/thioredoxin
MTTQRVANRFIFVLLLLALSSHAAVAQEKRAITEEEAAAIIKAAQGWWIENDPEATDAWDRYMRFVMQSLANVDYAQLDGAALHTLAPLLRSLPFDYATPADDRLRDLMRDPGADGAVAAAARLVLNYVRFPDGHEDWLRDAITHPGLVDAFRQGRAGEAWSYTRIVQPAALHALLDEVIAMEDRLRDDLPPEMALHVVGYDLALNQLGESVNQELRQRVRERTIALLDAAIEQGGGLSEFEISQLHIVRLSLTGGWARGELLNQPAPQIEFDAWIGASPVQSLADLRGIIVVLDLWATWCGACIAAFPKIRELQERFSDRPVRIIGLTWLQGIHYQRGRPPLDTSGNPEREYAAMAGLVGELDLTWPVAFAAVEAMGNFGIHEGVPQLIIIDADGVVRSRMIGWSADADEVADLIEALLRHP